MAAHVSENRPSYCRYGHRLGPGRILAGWMPCDCRRAIEAAGRGRGMGHIWRKCLGHGELGRETFLYDPPHVEK